MKFTFIFLSLIVLNFSLQAQVNLSGTIYNGTKETVPSSILILKASGTGQKLESKTDGNGAYSFKNIKTGKYELTAYAIGYKNALYALNLTKDTTLNITLDSLNSTLAGVTITAVKSTIENNTDKLVYNVATSITASGGDALNALSKVPGIKINDNQVSIAGKGTVRVMVNDQLIQLSGIDLTRFLKSISASQISKIELIKNPGANYDAEGNAGLINITTRQHTKKGYSANVQVNGKRWLQNPAEVYGTKNYQALNAGGDLSYNSSKLSAHASVNFDRDRHLEGFKTELGYSNQMWMQSDTGVYKYKNLNYEGGIDYKISPAVSLGVNYMGGKNTYDGSDHVNNTFTNTTTGKLDSTLKTFATYYPVAHTNAINLHSIIKFDTTGKKLLLNADYFNYYRTDFSDFESNSFGPTGQLNPEGRSRFYDTNKQNINIYTFKADALIPTHFAAFAFGGKMSIIDNYSNAFYYNKGADDALTYNPDLSNEFDYSENTQSLYASMNIERGQWKYKLGFRGEFTQTKGYSYSSKQNTTNDYFKLFPSLLVSYQPDVNNNFSFTFGRRINRPTFWNLNPYKSLYTAYSYGQGNPYLQPEYNSNFELSHIYKSLLTSSLFFNMTDNGFVNVTMAQNNDNIVFTTPINFIKTYRYGVTENLSLSMFKWLENNNQVNFYYTNAKSQVANISSVKGFGLYLGTSNSIYFNEAKTFAAAVNFWYQFPEIDHIGHTNGYCKLDFGLKAAALKKKIDLSLSLNDALLSSVPTISTTVNQIQQKLTNFQLYRHVLFGISYHFGNTGKKSEERSSGNEEERGRI